MKKVLFGIVVLFVVASISFLITGIFRKLKDQRIVAEKIQTLPSFNFLTLSGEMYNSKLISKGPVLIVHFHPECEHCQYEISEIFRSKIPSAFSNVILVSSAHPDSVRNFLSDFNFKDYRSVIPLIDNKYDFEDIFGSGIIPSSYIYNKRLVLIKELKGEVKSETILKRLEEGE
jgi:hypothetical protein